jgi:hypothetical protein
VLSVPSARGGDPGLTAPTGCGTGPAGSGKPMKIAVSAVAVLAVAAMFCGLVGSKVRVKVALTRRSSVIRQIDFPPPEYAAKPAGAPRFCWLVGHLDPRPVIRPPRPSSVPWRNDIFPATGFGWLAAPAPRETCCANRAIRQVFSVRVIV